MAKRRKKRRKKTNYARTAAGIAMIGIGTAAAMRAIRTI